MRQMNTQQPGWARRSSMRSLQEAEELAQLAEAEKAPKHRLVQFVPMDPEEAALFKRAVASGSMHGLSWVHYSFNFLCADCDTLEIIEGEGPTRARRWANGQARQKGWVHRNGQWRCPKHA